MTKFKLPDDLYTYQKEDAYKISHSNEVGDNWFNFSEMGVGKTPISLQVIEGNRYNLPLIVCPNSLRFEWVRQIQEWTEEDAAVSLQNVYTRLGPIIRSLTNGIKYKIINYETLRSREQINILKHIPFDIIVFDEIHKLRNPKTKLTKGVWEFLENYSKTKIVGLTGSPIVNYPNDLYTPLTICYPERYPRTLAGWRNFMYKYCMWSEGRNGPYIYGTRNTAELKEATKPFIVNRTKKEVLPFLPDKYYKRVELEMPDEQRKLYDQMATQLRILLDTGEPLWSTSVLSTLTRLRQINIDPKIIGISCPSAKTDFLKDLLDSTNEKIVVFSCFERYIYLLQKMLQYMEIPCTMVTGEVLPDKRAQQVKLFQEDLSVKVFLGTVQTAGEGITLTAASTIVFTDRWWNEPTNQQAIDRLHRIGQKNAVQVIYPLCKSSIDDLLDAVLERKHQASQDFLPEHLIRDQIIPNI